MTQMCHWEGGLGRRIRPIIELTILDRWIISIFANQHKMYPRADVVIEKLACDIGIIIVGLRHRNPLISARSVPTHPAPNGSQWRATAATKNKNPQIPHCHVHPRVACPTASYTPSPIVYSIHFVHSITHRTLHPPSYTPFISYTPSRWATIIQPVAMA